MKVLLLYDYPPAPSGLATQGHLLERGLQAHGVDVHSCHFESDAEKEWYYRWFSPDVVVGVGYWGHVPHLVLHPQRFGQLAVPWLVADGFVADYHAVLNALPLILVTSDWVKHVYARDGVATDNMETLPVGCDTDAFIPRSRRDPAVEAVRASFNVAPDEVLLLTVGGDAASKGAQEVMQALALMANRAPKWRYVCKVWSQPRTDQQNLLDMQLAKRLGIERFITYASGSCSRNYMPYLLAACDIYAAPARLEGFGMPQVEAGACGRPVVGIKAMAMLETLVHGQTAFLARVAQEVRLKETVLADQGTGRRVVFRRPRIADYRASVHDLAKYLLALMGDEPLRRRLGEAGRARVVERYDYRMVAAQFIRLMQEKLGLS